jgi:hypothetical protein
MVECCGKRDVRCYLGDVEHSPAAGLVDEAEVQLEALAFSVLVGGSGGRGASAGINGLQQHHARSVLTLRRGREGACVLAFERVSEGGKRVRDRPAGALVVGTRKPTENKRPTDGLET